MAGPFKLRSQGSSFKTMGSSPLKDPGHGGKKGHGHTTVFGTKVEDIEKKIVKVAKDFWEHKDPFPNINLAKSFSDEASKITPERKKIKKHKLDKDYQEKRKKEIEIEDAGDKNMGRTAG